VRRHHIEGGFSLLLRRQAAAKARPKTKAKAKAGTSKSPATFCHPYLFKLKLRDRWTEFHVSAPHAATFVAQGRRLFNVHIGLGRAAKVNITRLAYTVLS